MTISVSDTLKEYIDKQVALGGYGTPGAFVEELVREAQKRQAIERVNALIAEGMESGESTPLTAADWQQIREEVREKHARRTRNP